MVFWRAQEFRNKHKAECQAADAKADELSCKNAALAAHNEQLEELFGKLLSS